MLSERWSKATQEGSGRDMQGRNLMMMTSADIDRIVVPLKTLT